VEKLYQLFIVGTILLLGSAGIGTYTGDWTGICKYVYTASALCLFGAFVLFILKIPQVEAYCNKISEDTNKKEE